MPPRWPRMPASATMWSQIFLRLIKTFYCARPPVLRSSFLRAASVTLTFTVTKKSLTFPPDCLHTHLQVSRSSPLPTRPNWPPLPVHLPSPHSSEPWLLACVLPSASLPTFSQTLPPARSLLRTLSQHPHLHRHGPLTDVQLFPGLATGSVSHLPAPPQLQSVHPFNHPSIHPSIQTSI